VQTISNIFLFPAFVLKYKGNENSIISEAGFCLQERLREVSAATNEDIADFDIAENTYLENELKNQLLTYTISCIYSDILLKKNIQPKGIAALSMGIYAALYSAKSVSFHDGAILIKRVYLVLKDICNNQHYSMLNIIGLNRSDIENIIRAEKLNSEIVIKNNEFAYIVSGETDSISKLQLAATEEGAMHLSKFPVSLPYHSAYLESFIKQTDFVFDNLKVTNSQTPYFSTLKQSYISDAHDIMYEIIQNPIRHINWYKTMIMLHKIHQKSYFHECGPGNSLKKISAMIDKNIIIKSV